MTEQHESHITDEVKALIGAEAPPSTMWGTISADSVRRFIQAIMDDDPVYWDEEYASQTKYGGVVCPPLYPGFASHRAPGTAEPLDALDENRDWDGIGGGGGSGLPPMNLPVSRVLNGGVEAEFFQLAKIDDQITATTRYKDVTDRTGRSGYMVIVRTETEYRNQDGELLSRVINTTIRR